MNITFEDAVKAAESINIEPEAILAVIRVETPFPHMGDTPDGKPLILNERHWFYKLSGKYPVSKTYPKLSNKKAGGYCRGVNWIERQRCEHKRLDEKMSIYGGVLKEASLKSISMGLFQVMGFNHNVIGYNSVFSMWEDACVIDDTIDLQWFLEFVKANYLDDELQRKDWAGFARGYNGPAYARNKYDVKLAQSYAFFKDKYKDFEQSENIVEDVNEIEYNPEYEEVLRAIAPEISKVAKLIESHFPDFSQVKEEA